MDVKAGYKKTKVGVIPEEWDVSIVDDLFEVKLGKMLDAARNSGAPKPFVGNRAVQWGKIDTSDLSTVPLLPVELARFRLEKGDLLVCEGGEVGRAAIWDSPIHECYYQKALHRLRPTGRYLPVLMLQTLRRWSESGLLRNYVTQTSIAHLPREKLIEIPVAVPPLPEQRAIAAALSDVDALIAKLDQIICKKRDLKQAAMQQLLTGKTRLPGFSGEWTVKRLGEVADVVMGQSPSSSNYNTVGDGLPLIQGNGDVKARRTITRCYTSEITKRGVQGDLILSVRAPVGEVAVTLFDCCLGRGVCAIRRGSPILYHLLILLEPNWARLSKGSTFDSVNSDDVRDLELFLPNDLPEQTAIAQVLSDLEADISVLEARRDKTKALKQGMMQELLTGRIRLV